MHRSTSLSDKFRGILSDLSSFVGLDSSTGVEPACASHDRNSFVERVHSFQSSTWFAKPCWLSPVVCARYGWVNIDVDLVRCVGCQSVLVVRIPSSFDPAIYGACQKRLTEQLKCAAHHPCCTWPGCPTPEVLILPHAATNSCAAVVKDFVTKTLHLHSIEEALPAVDHSGLNVTESDVTALCDLVRNSSDFELASEVPDALRSAVLLALIGWELKDNCESLPGCSSLQCLLCMRQPGLWNYVNLTSGNGEQSWDHQNALVASSEDLQSDGSQSEHDIVDGHDDTACVQLPTDNDYVSPAVASVVAPVSPAPNRMMNLQESCQEVAANSESEESSSSLGIRDNESDLDAVNSYQDDANKDVKEEQEIIDTEEYGDHSSMENDYSNIDLLMESENLVSSETPDTERLVELTESDDHLDTVADYQSPSAIIQSEGENIILADVEVTQRLDVSTANYDGDDVADEGMHLPDDPCSSETVHEEPGVPDTSVKEESESNGEVINDDSHGLGAGDNLSYMKETEVDEMADDVKVDTSNSGNNVTECVEVTDSSIGKLAPFDDDTDERANVHDSNSLCDDVDSENVSSVTCQPPCDTVEDDCQTDEKSTCTAGHTGTEEYQRTESSQEQSPDRKPSDIDVEQTNVDVSNTVSDCHERELQGLPASDIDSEAAEDIRQLLAELVERAVPDDGTRTSLKRPAPNTPSDGVEQPACKRQFSAAVQQKVFNPVSEHRVWCPYIARVPADGPNNHAGDDRHPWLRYLRQLLPDAQAAVTKFRRSSMPEGIEHIRQIFHSWTSTP